MRNIVLFFYCVIILNLAAQSASQADGLFNRREFAEARKIYALLLESKPQDPLFNYRYARCSYELKDFDSAIKHFIIAGNRYPLRNFYLADSYFHTYRFEEALEFYNIYINSSNPNVIFLKDAKQKVQRATLSIKLMQNIRKTEITDSIITNKDEFIKHFRLGRETGTISHQILNLPERGRIDLTTWTNPSQDIQYYSDTLNNSINIFRTVKNEFEWLPGTLLSEVINTTADENFPFLTNDGLSIYFASNGENSIGGYDIFIATKYDSQTDFQPPVNIGMPFNSIYNDYMMVIDKHNNTGWFVTDRFQSENNVIIYKFVYTGQSPLFITDASADDLVSYAKLRKFRKLDFDDFEALGLHLHNDFFVASEDNVPSGQMSFVINDQITYSDISQFRSEKALYAWQQLQGFRKMLSEYEHRLSGIRRDFDTVEDQNEKKSLGSEISRLETEVVRMRLQINEKEKIARNEEIKTILNTQMQ